MSEIFSFEKTHMSRAGRIQTLADIGASCSQNPNLREAQILMVEGMGFYGNMASNLACRSAEFFTFSMSFANRQKGGILHCNI